MSRSESRASNATDSSTPINSLCKQLAILSEANSNGIISTLYCRVSLPIHGESSSHFLLKLNSSSKLTSHTIHRVPLLQSELHGSEELMHVDIIRTLGLVTTVEEKQIDVENELVVDQVGKQNHHSLELTEVLGSVSIASREGEQILAGGYEEEREYLIIIKITSDFQGYLPRFCNAATIPLPLCRNASLMLSLPSPSKLDDGWDLSIHPSLRAARSFADDESDLEWTEGKLTTKDYLTIRWTGRGTGEDGALKVTKSDLDIDWRVAAEKVDVIIRGRSEIEYAGMREKGWIELELLDDAIIGNFNVVGEGVVGSEISTSPIPNSPLISSKAAFSPISSESYPPSPSPPVPAPNPMHDSPLKFLPKKSASAFSLRSFSSFFGESTPVTPSDLDVFETPAPLNLLDSDGRDAFETNALYPPSLLRMSPPFTSTIGEGSMMSYEPDFDDSVSSDTEFPITPSRTLLKVYFDLSKIITSEAPRVDFVLSFSLPLSAVHASPSHHTSSYTIIIPSISLRATGEEDVVTTVSTVEGLISNASYLDGSEIQSPLPASDGTAKWVTRKKLGEGRERKQVEILVFLPSLDNSEEDRSASTPSHIDAAAQTVLNMSTAATSTTKITTHDKGVYHDLSTFDSSTTTTSTVAVTKKLASPPPLAIKSHKSRFISPFVLQIFIMIVLFIFAHQLGYINIPPLKSTLQSYRHSIATTTFSFPTSRTILSLQVRSTRPTFPPQYTPRSHHPSEWSRINGTVLSHIQLIMEWIAEFDWKGRLMELVGRLNDLVAG